MKHTFLKRALALGLVLCLVLSLAGCSMLRRVRRDRDEDEETEDVSDTGEKTDASGKPADPGNPDGPAEPGQTSEQTPPATEPGEFSGDIIVDPGDPEILDMLTDEQKAQLAAMLGMLETELSARLAEAGIVLDVDARTCEITLPAAILFAGDSSELSKEGKDFLAKYVGIYNAVILNSDYNRYVGYILIEGHTAPLADSTYESGLPLSQERAEVVRDFCLSEQAGTSAADAAKLGSLLVAQGSSNTRPVMKADGTADLNASRRVTFRVLFRLPAEGQGA